MAKDSDSKEITPSDETILEEVRKGGIPTKQTIVDTHPPPTEPPEASPSEDD